MARLEPFAGIRYDSARVNLDDVVSPPYDVVGPAERAELAARSPYNAIHVELPVPDEAAGIDRYDNAARIFRGWLDAAIVRRDPVPGFYLYQMRFHDEHGRQREHPEQQVSRAADASGRVGARWRGRHVARPLVPDGISTRQLRPLPPAMPYLGECPALR